MYGPGILRCTNTIGHSTSGGKDIAKIRPILLVRAFSGSPVRKPGAYHASLANLLSRILALGPDDELESYISRGRLKRPPSRTRPRARKANSAVAPGCLMPAIGTCQLSGPATMPLPRR